MNTDEPEKRNVDDEEIADIFSILSCVSRSFRYRKTKETKT